MGGNVCVGCLYGCVVVFWMVGDCMVCWGYSDGICGIVESYGLVWDL